MYSKSSTTINIKHTYSLLTNLCGKDVYLMRIKGRPKAARNLGSLSFLEETFLARPDKSIRAAQSERRISNFFGTTDFKSLFESLYMQNSNYAVITTEQLGYRYPHPAKRECILA